MATTFDQDPGRFATGYDVTAVQLAASTTVPAGTLALNSAGSVVVFTSALYVAGAKLLGLAHCRYENLTASVVTGKKMTFRRGCTADLAGKAGDLPLAADIGGTVYVSDNNTVQKTLIASGLAVTLVAIKGNSYRVQLP